MARIVVTVPVSMDRRMTRAILERVTLETEYDRAWKSYDTQNGRLDEKDEGYFLYLPSIPDKLR
jgi:hypothetical protein